MRTPFRPARCLAVLTGIAAAGLLLGCTETHAVFRVGPPRGHVGSWQAVLPGPAVVEGSAIRGHASWIDTRCNDALSTRHEGPLLATTSWPERDRPTLSRPRTISVPRSPDHYTYYRSNRDRYEHHHHW